MTKTQVLRLATALLGASVGCHSGLAVQSPSANEPNQIRSAKTADELAALREGQRELKEKLDALIELNKELIEVTKQAAASAHRTPRARPPGPDSQTVYALPIAGSATIGPKYAKVTIVEAFEFACPFCKRVAPTVTQLREHYGNDLKVVYKHFIVHPTRATIPALAACAADKQGKFAAMAEAIFAMDPEQFVEDSMYSLAKKLRLKLARFKSDMNGPCKQQVRDEQEQVARFGSRGTPAFFINGRFLSGARPIEQFQRLIDEELAKANERIANGEATVKTYYHTFVLARGQKKL